jgi:CBS domain-containing protein
MKHIGTIAAEREVLTVDPDQSVAEAAEKMRSHNIGCLVVIGQAERIVGILTERDIISKVVAVGGDAKDVLVAEVMTRKIVACSLDTPLSRAQQIMAQHGIRHLPIVENGRPVGMISSRDMLAHQLQAVQAVVRRQGMVLHQLEKEHPGITRIETDRAGRVVI